MPWCDLRGQICELSKEDEKKYENEIVEVLQTLDGMKMSLESKIDILVRLMQFS